MPCLVSFWVSEPPDLPEVACVEVPKQHHWAVPGLRIMLAPLPLCFLPLLALHPAPYASRKGCLVLGGELGQAGHDLCHLTAFPSWGDVWGAPLSAACRTRMAVCALLYGSCQGQGRGPRIYIVSREQELEHVERTRIQAQAHPWQDAWTRRPAARCAGWQHAT